MAGMIMNPWRKGRAAGQAWREEFDEYRKTRASGQPATEPVRPTNPYPIPEGKRGVAVAKSGWRQWDDGFRYGSRSA